MITSAQKFRNSTNMLILKRVKDLQQIIADSKKKGQTIGFVPTMGALHQGHLSLIKRSKKGTDLTLCSIFVNPTQFNDKEDLIKYPRTTEADIRLLSSTDCDILFIPEVEEVYPKGLSTELELNFAQMAEVMEGEFRPGHFDGMAQVVNRLLDIVLPHELFMGQKDFQQMSIVRSMLLQLNRPIKLVSCPIIREEHGLAMSSRNRRLSDKIRADAAIIFQTLKWLKSEVTDSQQLDGLKAKAMSKLSIEPFKAEYVEICDGESLQPIESTKGHEFIVCCLAVWVEGVRLIDNMVLRGDHLINE